jgi:hypothetical protein
MEPRVTAPPQRPTRNYLERCSPPMRTAMQCSVTESESPTLSRSISRPARGRRSPASPSSGNLPLDGVVERAMIDSARRVSYDSGGLWSTEPGRVRRFALAERHVMTLDLALNDPTEVDAGTTDGGCRVDEPPRLGQSYTPAARDAPYRRGDQRARLRARGWRRPSMAGPAVG